MRKRWRCFHCDEVFTSVQEARIHFGSDEAATCACVLPHEQHLVDHIRDLEEQLQGYRVEDSKILRSIYTLEADHRQALIRAEENGYNKGVQDMKAQGQCADPRAHDASDWDHRGVNTPLNYFTPVR